MAEKIIKSRQKSKLYYKRRLFYYIVLPIVFLVIFGWFCKTNFLINITDSMPKGLYKKESFKNLLIGDYVSICLDSNKAKLAVKHGILQSNNQCPDGSQMLIKQIIALPDDIIVITNKNIKVTHNSSTNIYAAPRLNFSKSKPVLTFIDVGTYQSNGYWLYGKYNSRNSWDSRYFGEVSAKNIINKLKPISIIKD